ncbi:uncharacterized protein LOC62_03G004758 [Vanrija pseudolonga]|uniref:Prolyl 4-hydroxylase alpha subunit domain-containing protein n=1 Tax=Vanrija pseudolonga TaxID=143232 RepID=A0AAF0YCB5_9TREE|nr:hypothetical protein LOC62_03G004758 [Vanrija pseudolonga]
MTLPPTAPSQPALNRIALPPGEAGTSLPESESFVDSIDALLTPDECADILRPHTEFGPVPGTHSKRTRVSFDDEALAELLWTRILPFYADLVVVDEYGARWTPEHLNPRFRLARYGVGGLFTPHFDGRRMASVDSQGFMTINIYLNTLAPDAGGATRYLSHEGREILVTQPEIGCAAAFRDSLLHEGAEVLAGEKYLLRTDVMFSRADGPFDFASAFGHLSKKEKGAAALKIAVAVENASNLDAAVEYYRKAFRLDPALEERADTRGIKRDDEGVCMRDDRGFYKRDDEGQILDM